MINHHSLPEIRNNLENKYNSYTFSERNLIDMRLRVMMLTSEIIEDEFLSNPFKGNLYMDETYFKENQSGTLEDKLYNAYPDVKEKRESRHSTESMKNGVMSDDFANVLCIVDENNRAYAKLISMGKTSEDIFNKEIVPKLDISNIEILCTDSQVFFKHFCKKNNIMQSVTPSGYYLEMNKLNNLNEEEKFNSMKVLYEKGKLGFINYKNITYDFKHYLALVNTHELRLDKVNKFHANLKRVINRKYNGVPTKNLQAYVSWITFLHNYRITHGSLLTNGVSKEILIYLLRKQQTIKRSDIDDLNISKIQRPTKKEFVELTVINRVGQEVNYKYKAHPNDNVIVRKKDIIESLNIGELKDFCRYAKIKRFSTMNVTELRKAIRKYPDFKTVYTQYKALLIKDYTEYDEYKDSLDNSLKIVNTLSKSNLLSMGYTKKDCHPIRKDCRINKTIFIDVETTGIEDDDEVLSLCIINRNRQVLFKEYIKPILHKSWDDAEKINHISPEYIFKYGKSVEDIIKEIKPIILYANEIIAYNVDFDLKMLKPFLHKNNFNRHWVNRKCAMHQFAKINNKKRFYTLEKACHHYNIKINEKLHDAETDAKACLDLWLKMYPDYFK